MSSIRPPRCFPSRHAAGLLPAALLLLAACSDGTGNARGEPVVRDSAGVAIVEHPVELPARDEWTIALDGAVRMADDFSRIRYAIRLEDGRIVVADGDSRTLRFFDAEGASLGVTGRQGGGPGEFRDISFMSRWPGDSILVWDLQQRRLSLHDDQGTLVRTFAPATSTDVPFGNVRGVFGDGSMLATGFVAGGGPQPGRQRSASPAYHFQPDGSLDVAYPFMVSGEGFFEVFENGGFSAIAALFPRSTMLYAGREILVEADNERFDLRIRTPSGELQRSIRRAGQTPPITSALRQAAVEHALETMPNAAARDRRRPTLETMEVPAFLPAFDRVHVDRMDHLWVEEYATIPPERSTWFVFAPDGTLVARATMPHRLTPMEIGRDYLLGVHRDELDVEEVVLVRLVR